MIVVLDIEESPCFHEALKVIQMNCQDVYTQPPSLKQLEGMDTTIKKSTWNIDEMTGQWETLKPNMKGQCKESKKKYGFAWGHFCDPEILSTDSF